MGYTSREQAKKHAKTRKHGILYGIFAHYSVVIALTVGYATNKHTKNTVSRAFRAVQQNTNVNTF